eukprot:m.60942 g.60942  ORF g.60942 m.60942 type:complete len:74 (+) comp34957_c0_seq2:642-863(+)
MLNVIRHESGLEYATLSHSFMSWYIYFSYLSCSLPQEKLLTLLKFSLFPSIRRGNLCHLLHPQVCLLMKMPRI